MPLVEIAMTPQGRIKATKTAVEYVPSELDTKVAEVAAAEHRELETKWDLRRAKFFEWALSNPSELDMMLDECDNAGILFGFEYNE